MNNSEDIQLGRQYSHLIKLQDVFVEIIEALLRKVFAAQSGRCLQFK